NHYFSSKLWYKHYVISHMLSAHYKVMLSSPKHHFVVSFPYALFMHLKRHINKNKTGYKSLVSLDTQYL
ncbi:MAG: hypothetical protein RR582_05570, partial [Niameybacter sp.]